MTREPDTLHVGSPLPASERLRVGARLFLGPGCQIGDEGAVEIGDDVICGANVKIPGGPDELTRIGAKVWLGDGAQVRPGARIGEGALICSGAIVIGSVPPHAVMEGNPARVTWKLKW